MSHAATDDWGLALEESLFAEVVGRAAPGFPLQRAAPPRFAETPAEIAALSEDWVRTAAHDLFIVQVTGRAIGGLFADAPEVQLLLSRQLGDDGDHAVEARQHVWSLSGRDPLPRIAEQVREHWERAGDIPLRSLAGFLAFEFHYELYILAKMQFMRKTGRVADAGMKSFSEARIRPDEAVHRQKIVEWWLAYRDALPAAEREALLDELVAHDEALQQRLNPFVRFEFDELPAMYGCDIAGAAEVYDEWRRTLLARLTGRAANALGSLTPLPRAVQPEEITT